MNFRETLKNLIYIHDFNGMDNTTEIKKLLLINVDPNEILKITKKISFKKKSYSLYKNIINSLDKVFFYNLFLISFVASHLESLE